MHNVVCLKNSKSWRKAKRMQISPNNEELGYKANFAKVERREMLMFMFTFMYIERRFMWNVWFSSIQYLIHHSELAMKLICSNLSTTEISVVIELAEQITTNNV